MIFLIILLSVFAWFVFGYFAARMAIMEKKDFWGDDASRALMLCAFFLGLFAWLANMGPGVMSSTGIRRRAHFIPVKAGPVGPSEKLMASWFGVRND